MASGGDVEEVVVAMSKASIEVVEEVGKKKIDRHCAFCLNLVPGEEVKTCSKCKRRAYCSKECQKADWIRTGQDLPVSNGEICGYGQGHKNWCGLPYGEEDLDWKVVPIEGKGLGIVALRDIPYLYRILIEGMQYEPNVGFYNGPPEAMQDLFGVSVAGPRRSDGSMSSFLPYHPAMNDLHPANADVFKKFEQNHFMTTSWKKLGLRLSRINHSCRPNAAFIVEPYPPFAVLVVSAEREIKAGEEICRCYLQGKNFPFRCEFTNSNQVDLTYKTPEQCREEYSSKWGIVCSPSCPCLDERNAKLLEELKEFGEYCVANPLKKPALQKCLKVIENAKKFGIGTDQMISLYFLAFELAVTRRQTLGEAKKYLQMALEIMKAVLHPKSFLHFKDTSVIPDITKHPKYLAAEFDT